MYSVSNSQMEYIKAYLGMLIDAMPVSDNRSYNTRRMAKNLLRKLEAKQPLPASALSDIKRKNF